MAVEPRVAEKVAGTMPPAPCQLSRVGGLSPPALRFGVFVLVLSVSFSAPLLNLARYAFATDLASHILLIPFVAAYLIWQMRSELRGVVAKPSKWAILPFLVGLSLLGASYVLRRGGWRPVSEDHLCIVVFSLYCLVLGGGFLLLGKEMMGRIAFPMGFLIFIVPLPSVLIDGLEVFFQHTSAEATNVLFTLTGMPCVRDGLVFQLPGITIKVAQECSGIRSSLVLFITSLLAGHLFLRTIWRRTLFACMVVPLGILRNGFRILTISMLCVHVDPNMIDSPIHHRGGPLFFVLSLVPFFLLLLYLRRSELGGRTRNREKETT